MDEQVITSRHLGSLFVGDATPIKISARAFFSAFALTVFCQAQTPVTITANPSAPGYTIPTYYQGLSYEINSGMPCNPGWQLDPSDPVTQQLMKNLAPAEFRIGGNSVDQLTGGWTRSPRTGCTDTDVLHSSDVDTLMQLARDVGWRVLWSENLQTGTSSSDADQADYVMATASDVVDGIAIGNEPQYYPNQTPSSFQSQWQPFYNDVVGSAPSAKIYGWDTTDLAITTTQTSGTFLQPVLSSPLGGEINFLGSHLYSTLYLSRSGLPIGISDLLNSTTLADEQSNGSALLNLAQSRNIPYRMTETDALTGSDSDANPGVVNVFANSLWTVDYSFIMAQQQAAGLNFHCGAGGGFPAAPIGETSSAVHANPGYYGMLMFKYAAQGRLVPLTVNTNGVNLTSYATLDSLGALRVTIINKDQANNAAVTITPGSGYTTVTGGMWLQAPSVTSSTGITLGGASVAADGTWAPTQTLSGAVSNGTYDIAVPAASAVFVAFGSSSSPDFSLTATPNSQTVTQGASTTYTTTITPVNSFSGTVNFSIGDLPSGATGSFNPTSVTGSGDSTLTVATSSATPAGTDTLTLTGTSGSLLHSTPVTLVVNAAPTPDFGISVTPSSQTVTRGSSTSYTVTMGALNGFTGTVSLSASGLPNHASASFNPASVTSSGNSTLKVQTGSMTHTGTFALTITGTSGSLTHSTTVKLVVQ